MRESTIAKNRILIIHEILFLSLLVWIKIPPSTSLYLLFLGWLSLRLRKLTWRDLGLCSPKSWTKTLLLGGAGGLLYFVLTTWGIEPFLQGKLGKDVNLELFESLVGNWKMLFLWLTVAWTLAAFGEELVYRGYILNRVADIFMKPPTGFWIGVLVNSLLFGLAHAYQGIVGVIMSILFGLAISVVYLWNERNMWTCILFHGIYDTPGLIFIFLGLHH